MRIGECFLNRAWAGVALAAVMILSANAAWAKPAAGKAITADHSAAVAVRQALVSGDFFKAGFMIKPASDSSAKRTQAQLDALRKRLPAKAKFNFIEGVEITLSRAALKGAPMAVPMAGENYDNGSVFRLPRASKRQVYLIYSFTDKFAITMKLHLLMWPSRRDWKAASVVYFPAKIGSMTFDLALAAGRAEEQSGNDILAFALYALAAELGKDPPYRVSSASQRRLKAIFDPLIARLNLPKKPIDTVHTINGKVDLIAVSATVIPAKPCLELHRKVRKVPSRQALRSASERIAAEFYKKHPRLSRYFGAIAVNSVALKGKRVKKSRVSFTLETLQGKPAQTQPALSEQDK